MRGSQSLCSVMSKIEQNEVPGIQYSRVSQEAKTLQVHCYMYHCSNAL